MSLDSSFDCECPTCLESIYCECDYNPYWNKNGNDTLCLRPKEKYPPSFMHQRSSTPCCSTQPENAIVEVFLPSEEESSSESSQKNPLGMTAEDISEKTKPLRELTIQELLREFGDNKKPPPTSTSLGHFKDQVVIKFRRALYYSGIWVSHVQGHRMEKHLSANHFKRNPSSLHRLIPWLKRELTAVCGDYGYTVKKILTTILQHMTEYDLDSEAFIALLEPYLLQHSHHFLHEFISFVHSPFNVETYDQLAIYNCSTPSPWMKNKSVTSASVLPFPEDQAQLVSHHNTRPSKNTPSQRNNEEKQLSTLKPFPNCSSFSKKSEVKSVNHKTSVKTYARMKDKLEPADHKSTLPTNSNLNWASPVERGTGLMNCKAHIQERMAEERKPSPDQDQNPGKNETNTSGSPVRFNKDQPCKCSLREKRDLSPDQQVDLKKKEVEKTKYLDSSPKIFERLPRGRAFIICNARKRDPSWSCISEIALSPKRENRKRNAFRKKRMTCKESSQCAETGSRWSRSIKKRSKVTTQRSKSCSSRYRERSLSRESSNFCLRRSYNGEHFSQNQCHKPSKEKNTYGYELNHEWTSFNMIKNLKLADRVRSKCLSDEDSSHAGSCDSLTYLHPERHKFPSEQKMQLRTTFPGARRNRAAGHRKNKYQCPDEQITNKASREVWDEGDIKQMSSLDCLPSSRKQIKKKQENLNLRKCHGAKNEHRETTSGTQKHKLF